MALNPLYVQAELPTTSQAAIREFNERYLAAIGASQPSGWADDLGDLIPVNSPMTTFPVSQLRTLYKRTEAEGRFKTLLEKSFDVKVEEFDDGYQARLMDLFLKIFAYRKWQEAPSRLVLAEEQFRHSQIAALLLAGTTTTCVDGQNFFSTAHPANMVDSSVAGTWSNYQSTAADFTDPMTGITSLQTECVNMSSGVMDENGQPLGARADTILCPLDVEEPLNNLLAKNLILAQGTGSSANVAVGAVSNPYIGRFKVIGVKEWPLTSGTTRDSFLIDSKLIKLASPWMSARLTVPGSLALRTYDESSDYFKDTGNIKVGSHIWYGFSLVLPHAIRRVKGTTR